MKLSDLYRAVKTGYAPDLRTMGYARILRNAAASVIQMVSGALPLSFAANGMPLVDYVLYGDTLQDGTPTPDAPVDVWGCGDRTGNLLQLKDDYSANLGGVDITIEKGNITIKGTRNNSSGGRTSYLSETFVLPAGTYAIRGQNVEHMNYCLTKVSDQSAVAAVSGIGTFTIDAATEVAFGINFISGESYDATINIMLNAGETAQPYEPYGYKIPISVQSEDGTESTTAIYLGEVPTTRRIKKIDLGTLNWVKTQSGNFLSAEEEIDDIRIVANNELKNALCSAFKEAVPEKVGTTPYSFSSCLNNKRRVYINPTGFEDMTAEEFKAAMSGVYMWYVLNQPETGIVNEPLLKIGDYADTVSMTQAGATIPTFEGTTTIDTETAVKPSYVEIRYTPGKEV